MTGSPPVCFPVDDAGLWVEVRRHRSGRSRPALFLDRDGTLVEEVDFLHRPADVRLLPGAATAIRAASAAGWLVVIVTNQSGIGRGRFSWQDFSAVQLALIRCLASEGAGIDMVLACPHHPDGLGRFAHAAHPARKPAPGMLLAAARHLPIDLSGSAIIGDRASDLAAGRSAGLASGFLVETGYGTSHQSDALALQTANFGVAVLPVIGAWSPPHGPEKAGPA